MGYVDLHSHILPGLDDGSPDMSTSIQLIEGLAELGFETVCATPHQKAGQYMPSAASIGDAYRRVRRAATGAGVEIEIVLAAENMWDAVFFERVRQRSVPGYARGCSFLVEFRIHELPTGLLEQVFRMRVDGLLPVIAHPERYQPLWKQPTLAQKLSEQCAMVVDLGAVAGYHGRKQAKIARSYLRKGWAHAAASDVHALPDVRMAAEGIGWIRKKLGEDALIRLLDTAPRRILSGQHPSA